MFKAKIIIILLLILAAFLRIYNLANNPPAAYGDETSFAWNAWNILKTGTDEYGTPIPLQFRAFDDYKAPIPVYLLVPVIKFLGLNTFAIRLPVAIVSVFTILIMFLLVKELLGEKIGLIAAFLLTISPWHMHLSRGYFESTLALFFLILGIYFFILSKKRAIYLFLACMSFALTLYTYFTPRIMLIIFIPFLLFWGRIWLSQIKKKVLFCLICLFIILIPLIYASFFEKGLSRINKLTTLRSEQITRSVNQDIFPYLYEKNIYIHKVFHNKYFYWIKEISTSYLEHFSINFWYLTGDNSLRYFLGNMGMFYLLELPFLILGIYFLFRNFRHVFYLLLGWLLIAPIPASISGRPFAVRSLSMLPAGLTFSAAGIYFFLKLVKQITNLKILLAFLFMCSFVYYFVRYHVEYPVYAATWWGWENKAAIDLATKEADNYDQIFISSFYSGTDLAFGFYNAVDPSEYRKIKSNPIILADNRKFFKFGKFYIGSFDINDNNRLNSGIIPSRSLYIARPEEISSAEVIRAPDDGRILFYVYRTN